ncbi:MAG: SGNH/GDSL hydrolase family protein [Chitinophagaceae bacterium]|nr:SGNH/GDSL hydrolase family protein [Chitinophagaceae bacterium]
MKKKLIFVVVVIIGVMSVFMTGRKPLRVVFFGDSITQAGVDKGGYIDLIQNAINAKGLQNQYELIGAGISGNKVYDLYLRMEDDVIAKQPDIVFIYVGINDVWHKTSSGTGTDPDKFVKFYNAIIKKLKDRKIRVILCTPSVIGEKHDASNPQDGDLNAYATTIREIAAITSCELVDLRKGFQEYELKNNSRNAEKGILTRDRVHLNGAGNQLVADLMMPLLMK